LALSEEFDGGDTYSTYTEGNIRGTYYTGLAEEVGVRRDPHEVHRS
jgi:predicted GIY-YIG superfamily endonuclease